MQFRKAERKKAKARVALSGPAGAGKTYSALLMAFGLGKKIAMIDTENGSGDLYAHLGTYDICQIKAPYEPQKYTQAIKAAEKEGYDVIIIDSLSHAWAGEGGILDMQGKIADSGKGNSYTAWRTVTPKHNELVEAMLQSSSHIIATVRAKTEYVQEKNSDGKTVIRKVGLAPIQRDGLEFEFTVFIDISIDHTASSSKDRTSLFDGRFFKLSMDTGVQILTWLESGAEPTQPPSSVQAGEAPAEPPAPPKDKTNNFKFLETMGKEKKRIGEESYYKILGRHGFEHANEVADRDAQLKIFKELKEITDLEVA